MDVLMPQIQSRLDLGKDWIVDQILLNIDKQSILLYVSHSGEELTCPETGEKTMLYDHTQEQVWRHLDLWEYKCFIHCQVPRVKSASGIKPIKVPWGKKSSRVTPSFERGKDGSTA